jgi:DNA-binding transcriptional ArsR family regulator
MKCCPKDKNIKKEWTNKLESESSNITNDRVIEISNFCKVFSHPLRVKVALLLNKRDLCVCEIVSILKEKQNLVSHNLSIMRKYRVVNSYNQSNYKYYYIERAAAVFLDAVDRTYFFNEKTLYMNTERGT